MGLEWNRWSKAPLLAATILGCGLLVAGCDEHVEVVRDHSVRINKHATWAWSPAEAHENNPIISEDRMSRYGRRETVTRESRFDNENLRVEMRAAVSNALLKKGFREVSDPQAADFLVDYHVGIRRHNMTVERVRPGGYPALVCGPFGCWESYRWGYWGPPEVSYQNVNYREGTMVFDFIDQRTKRVAFRAVGTEPITHDSLSPDHVRGAIERLLRDLRHGKE